MIATPARRSPLRFLLPVALGILVGGLTAHTVHARGSRTSWSTGYGEGFSWILVREGGENLSGSGETQDFELAKRLARRGEHEFLVIRMDGRRYVIRDDALVGRASDAIEPSEILGREQGRLGQKQGELGRRQGELGRRQGELGRRQGMLAGEQARISARVALEEQRGHSTRDLEIRQRELEREMDALGDQQEELGRLQEELGRQQEPLGRQQEELGRQQEKLSHEMERAMRDLVEDAVREGKADPVR
jgi:hypothetical protein